MTLAKTGGIVLAALIFLFLMRRGLKRRESELAVPQPRWLREIEASIPLGEFELGAGRPVLEAPVSGRPGPPDVGAVARNQPEQVAAQVNQWLQEA